MRRDKEPDRSPSPDIPPHVLKLPSYYSKIERQVDARRASSGKSRGDVIDLSNDDLDPPQAGPSRKRPRSLSSSSSSVEGLAEAPVHLRKITNRDNPILIDDDSDDGTDGERTDQSSNILPPSGSNYKTFANPGRGHQPGNNGLLGRDESKSSKPLALSGQSPPEADPSTPVVSPALARADPADLVAQILVVLPDIDTEWALSQLTTQPESSPGGESVNTVLQAALEMEGGYPKMKAGKGDRKDEQEAAGYDRDTYRLEQRSTEHYRQKSLTALQQEFPVIPVTHISITFTRCKSLYYHTYFQLLEESKSNPLPFVRLRRPRPSKGAPHGIENPGEGAELDEWILEHRAVTARLAKDKEYAAEMKAKQAAHEAALAQGHGIECGCCFGEELVQEMFQCAEGHLFCRECATRHAETKLGDQETVIACMDTSGCLALFPESELARLLPAKSLSLYHRLKQAAELALAGVEGLESCPACDYAVVIENPDEKLFFCRSEACGQISCRKCRQVEHLPKTCEEMAADRKLDKRHLIEDAMSAALIRKCPQCSKPFLKDSGCNKITCSGCGTISCYVCRQAIKNGHFDQNSYASADQPRKSKKCVLWDQQEAQKDREAVVSARDVALQEARDAAQAEGINLEDADLDVAPPEAEPQPAGGIVPPAGARPGPVQQRPWIQNPLQALRGVLPPPRPLLAPVGIPPAAQQGP